MSSAYRSSLIFLVLLNVVFIHITGAIGVNWLVPLYLLTLAAFFTRGLRDNKLYRTAWNIAVLGIFTLLVIDATSSGITHLLEDGLMLAVFCQVHLLNVLQSKQKPDLLFFNSFLIALVTSFFSQDLIYSVTFLVYALVFLLALQMSNLSNSRHELRVDVAAAVMRDGARRAVLVLATTCLVFLFWPRDFHREGLVQEQMMWNRNNIMSVDFDEEVRLGRSAKTILSNRVVMKIHMLEGDPLDVPSHWRGATLSMQNQDRWYAGPAQNYLELDERWKPGPGLWQRSGEVNSRVRVEYLKPMVRRLFNPLGSIRVKVYPPANIDLAVPQFDGTIRYSGRNLYDDVRPPLQYEVAIANSKTNPVRSDYPPQLEQYRRQHREMVTVEAQALLHSALVGLDENASQADIVTRCRVHLSNQLDYLLPGEQGAAENLQEFMSGEAGGHCEYFASALAVMLRMREIPCRLAIGYLAQEWDAEFRTLIVRDKHAHAWLEVYEPGSGWYTVDPSPAASEDSSALVGSWFGSILKSAEEWWKGITQFDESSRGAAFDWFLALPGTALAQAREHPLRLLAWFATIATLVILRRRLRPGVAAELRAYERALCRAGLARGAHETPRELLVRARTEDLSADRLELLASATTEHETLRYQK